MILADTSAWIDYFADKDSYARRHLRLALVDDDLVIGDLVLVEILQGIRSERQLRETSGTLGHFKFVRFADLRSRKPRHPISDCCDREA